jgi:hypothetical protein
MAPTGRAVLLGWGINGIPAGALLDCQVVRAGGVDQVIAPNTSLAIATFTRTPDRREILEVYAQTVSLAADQNVAGNNTQHNIAVSPTPSYQTGFATQQTINNVRGRERTINLDGLFYLAAGVRYTFSLRCSCGSNSTAMIVRGDPELTFMFASVSGWWDA